MKLDRSMVLVAAAMVVGAIAATGCKSSGDPGDPASSTSDPGPSVQTPNGPAAPANSDDDNATRRARRHRGGHGRGHGEWHRKRRAWAQHPGNDDPGSPVPRQDPPAPQ